MFPSRRRSGRLRHYHQSFDVDFVFLFSNRRSWQACRVQESTDDDAGVHVNYSEVIRGRSLALCEAYLPAREARDWTYRPPQKYATLAIIVGGYNAGQVCVWNKRRVKHLQSL